jgi:cardiolipin synthase C
MNFKTGIGMAVAAAAIAVACTSFQKGGRGIAGTFDSQKKGAREFTDAELSKFSSTGAMGASKARVITDNYEAYKSKLDIINNAQRSLKLVYFIYADDSSSSQMTDALIRAANRGVKVELLVDFLTNFGSRIDLYKYMEYAGKGNITVRFYGMPSKPIIEGALYKTTACSPENQKNTKDMDACQDEKLKKVEQIQAQLDAAGVETTWFSRMYLTGQYGKNDKLTGVATKFGGGVDIDAMKANSHSDGPKPTAAQGKELGKLVYDAKVNNRFFAKVKLGMAAAKYGETLGPLFNQIFGTIPFAMGDAADWDHMTDYTHHKLIVADGRVFQMGGRNVEDSYHTDGYSKKYTFIDTDFYAESDVAVRVEQAYDTLASFSAMVGDMKRVEKITPPEYLVNNMQFLGALDGCLKGGQAANLENCVNTTMPKIPGYRSYEARMAEQKVKVAKGLQAFKDNYKAVAPFLWDPENKEGLVTDAGATYYYLENTSFNRDQDAKKRLFGSKVDEEHEHGKNIHASWIRAIENTCRLGAQPNAPKQRIVLHSAYLMMSAGLVGALGNTINGKWNCGNVQIDIITNSFATTDLNVLNVFARYQLRSLFQYYHNGSGNVDPSRKASLKYSEYVPHTPNADGSTPKSLHSKVSVFGPDIVIGSANADVRSYFMDTNNAIYIRNAPKLVSKYIAFIDKLDKHQADDAHIYYKMWEGNLTVPNESFSGPEIVRYEHATDAQIERQNMVIVNELVNKWMVPKPIKAKLAKKEALTEEEQTEMKELEAKKKGILLFVKERGAEIEQASMKFLQGTDSAKDVLEEANDFDQFWKLL